MTFSKWQLEPAFHPDTKEKWYQNCYVCNGQINFIKDPKHTYIVIVGGLVRHKKCNPGVPK